MKNEHVKLKNKNGVKYNQLSANEVKFLEKNKAILEIMKKKDRKIFKGKKEDCIDSPFSDISTFSIVKSRFDKAKPNSYENEDLENVSNLIYPISSSRADRMGNFHLGLGMGKLNTIINSAPNFIITEPEYLFSHRASAKICHSFKIDSFLGNERDYEIKSKISIPTEGGLQFEVYEPGGSKEFSNISYAASLVGNVTMKISINDSVEVIIQKPFLEWYKSSFLDEQIKIPGLVRSFGFEELEVDLSIRNNSILKVEIEVEIVATNLSEKPTGERLMHPNNPNLYIGVQYFNPDFVLNKDYDKVRYLFNELGQGSNFAKSISLDYIELIDKELNEKINPVYINDEISM